MSDLHRHPLPDWGPADLAARLGQTPLALLDGLSVGGRRCVLVAWAPLERFATAAEALAYLDELPPPSETAPAALYAAVGSLDWDGAAHLWYPAGAALFDPEAGELWWRGSLPPGVQRLDPPPPAAPGAARPRWPRRDFLAAVQTAQAAMAAGEVAKLILSVSFAAPCADEPLTVLRRLAAGDPPGLRFLLAGGTERDGALLGVSPEPLVLLDGRTARLHLLAGTRPAGADAADLAAHPKDRDEHTVAVELARQDLLSVCDPDSVKVERFMALEQHPGLVHLASDLTGRLRPDATPADLLRACFPAGTVGGVPRAAAVRLIDALEPEPRGWYAGAVGALLPGGDLQLWLTIRSLWLSGGTAVVRTGAGLVPASDPALEWQECVNKARTVLAAVGAEVMADGG